MPQCDLPGNSDEMRQHRVFLCHSSADKARVRDLYNQLRKDEFYPWFDAEDILPGQEWELAIREAVRAAYVVLVCLSKASITKTGFVQHEIKIALDVADERPEGTIFLIPLRFKDCEVPQRLRRWQWVDLFEPSGYDRLLRALKIRVLGSAAVSRNIGIIRVLAADDHLITREGVAALLSREVDLQLVAEATNGSEAVEQFRKHRPDVTLMDLQMPKMSGLDAISAICGEFPGARIIVLTSYAGDAQLTRAFKAGASGYLLKGMLRKDLLETIRAVHAGQKRVPLDLFDEFWKHAPDEFLTAIETEVLRLIAVGNANKEIAAQLSITEETVRDHVKNILARLRARDRTHAVTIGLKRGMIEL
jgi:DNA-binding NarL/FixJ family response regulator